LLIGERYSIIYIIIKINLNRIWSCCPNG